MTRRNESWNGEHTRRFTARAEEMLDWFYGHLRVSECRTEEAIFRAFEHFQHIWWGKDIHKFKLVDCVYLWDSISHDLSIAGLKQVAQPNAGHDWPFLEGEIPKWELGEISLVVGLLLCRAALAALKERTAEARSIAGLLLMDACDARHYWCQFRLTDCRNPDSKVLRAKDMVSEMEWRSKRRLELRKASNARYDQVGGFRQKKSDAISAYNNGGHTNHADFARKYCVKFGVEQRTVESWLSGQPTERN